MRGPWEGEKGQKEAGEERKEEREKGGKDITVLKQTCVRGLFNS